MIGLGFYIMVFAGPLILICGAAVALMAEAVELEHRRLDLDRSKDDDSEQGAHRLAHS